ncbi:MAG: hypothetical protein K2Y10_03965 [Burkholderiaceae bacterium]|nr:hypothetical protein [Burkholderiaceae bacterium]
MTLFITDPLSLKDAVVSMAVESPALAQGDFLFSDDPIVNWFDSQTEDTARFWLDRAVEMFGLPDSATPRQCWAAFCASATRGVLAPQLLTHAAVIRKHGQPLFTVHCPPGMLHLGNVAPFWSAKAFQGYLAALRAHGYHVILSGPSVASVLPPVRGAEQ